MSKSFRLQPVLKYRRLVEDRNRQQLAETLQHKQAAKTELHAHRDRYHALHDELEQRQQDGIPAHDLLLFKTHIDQQNQHLRRLEQKLERLREETAERRQKLQQASQDRQLLDNLREKFHQELRRDEDRREALLMDEIALRLQEQR